ncbi:hypothetical protein BSZ36_11830 [Rubricoccus marinus]|uniref:Lipoprotein n=2 Tax=Rubricoccus marinus TaxID=716817 RepID=A0A259U0T8_9BACT|nr:hypothetical protein BSZ36_11830 [Rubricoccus marinus]
MSLRLALFLALPLAACASGPTRLSPEHSAPEAPLTGTYTHDHEVGIFDGETFVPTPVTDELVLIERGKRLFVAANLVRANAHLCGVGGMFERENGRWVRREALDLYRGEDTCTLALTVTADTLALSDSANVCRQHYCGARAALDGARFARGTRTPDTTLSEW